MPLTVPNAYAAVTTDQPGSGLDANFDAVTDWINDRNPTSGLLANRPAAGNAGAIYTATDVAGGTTYLDTGAAWIQQGASVTQQAPTNTPSVMAALYLGGL